MKPLINHPQKGNTSFFYRIETIRIDRSMPKKAYEKIWIRDVEIIYTGKEHGLYRYHLLCSNINFRADLSVPGITFLRRAAYLFDEIKISVTQNGEIIKINNLAVLQKRWACIQQELAGDNKGAAVDSFFYSISNSIADEGKLIEFLSGYKMYGLYFNGLWGNNILNKIYKRQKVDYDLLQGKFIEENCSAKLLGTETVFSVMADVEKETVKQYEGQFIYNAERLTEGIVEIEHENDQIKYSILWVG